MEDHTTADLDLSVIIVSYHVRDMLENCLHSLKPALDGISHEIFVVDNHSDDNTPDMVRDLFPDVRLIANDENLGFAKANNQALKRARGRFLLLLNPDSFVQEDTLRVMLEFFAAHPDAGMASCKIMRHDGSFEPGCRRSFPSPWVSLTKLTGLSTLFPKSRLLARYNLTYLSEEETYEVDAISGSFMMLRRELYDRIGGLDESYFMYGEDLDWCYKTQQTGWKLYYVHSTKIIHYGGESTRRSKIDATAEFYRAMQVFARKNLGLSPVSLFVVSLGIQLKLGVSRFRNRMSRLWTPLLDGVFVMAAVFLAEFLRFGTMFGFPGYAYPAIYIASMLAVWVSLGISGTYSGKSYSIVRSGLGVLLSFLILSSLPYFFKDYAFSRAVVFISSALNFVTIPGWRIFHALTAPGRRVNPITGRATLFVGINESTLDILDKLKRHDEKTYNILGFIDVTSSRIGERYGGVEILGNIENIGKIIDEHRIMEVIFVPDALSYAEILSIISRLQGKAVHFHMVPKSMEYIVGKASIDQLGSVPLLDFDYNLTTAANRFLKRMFDLLVSVPVIIVIYPFAAVRNTFSGKSNKPAGRLLQLPAVVRGRKSLVGYDGKQFSPPANIYLGKPGLTGLAQLRNSGALSSDEQLAAAIQYARNYSIFLDIEIITRTLMYQRSKAE